MVRQLLAIFAICLLAMGAKAEDTALKRLETGDQTRDWQAVGRLDIDGKGFCTGALIREDLVLTAAHCLYDPATGEAVDLSKVEFLAGWREGRASAYRWVRRAIIHPEYEYSTELQADRVRNDIAILELNHPIRKSGVSPFPTAERPRKGEEIGLVSYGRSRSEAPSLQEICDVLARQQGVLVMSCDVDFGSSGAPVFSFVNGQPQVVSVVSAMANINGKKVSLGAQLDEPLAVMLHTLDTRDRLENRANASLFSKGEQRDIGAKFATPDVE